MAYGTTKWALQLASFFEALSRSTSLLLQVLETLKDPIQTLVLGREPEVSLEERDIHLPLLTQELGCSTSLAWLLPIGCCPAHGSVPTNAAPRATPAAAAFTAPLAAAAPAALSPVFKQVVYAVLSNFLVLAQRYPVVFSQVCQGGGGALPCVVLL